MLIKIKRYLSQAQRQKQSIWSWCTNPGPVAQRNWKRSITWQVQVGQSEHRAPSKKYRWSLHELAFSGDREWSRVNQLLFMSFSNVSRVGNLFPIENCYCALEFDFSKATYNLLIYLYLYVAVHSSPVMTYDTTVNSQEEGHEYRPRLEKKYIRRQQRDGRLRQFHNSVGRTEGTTTWSLSPVLSSWPVLCWDVLLKIPKSTWTWYVVSYFTQNTNAMRLVRRIS